MKRIILTIALISMMPSCVDPESKKSNSIVGIGKSVMTVEHEGCEYIIYDGYDGENIIHKNNCILCAKRDSIKHEESLIMTVNGTNSSTDMVTSN